MNTWHDHNFETVKTLANEKGIPLAHIIFVDEKWNAYLVHNPDHLFGRFRLLEDAKFFVELALK